MLLLVCVCVPVPVKIEEVTELEASYLVVEQLRQLFRLHQAASRVHVLVVPRM